jgi:hypothetical protein
MLERDGSARQWSVPTAEGKDSNGTSRLMQSFTNQQHIRQHMRGSLPPFIFCVTITVPICRPTSCANPATVPLAQPSAVRFDECGIAVVVNWKVMNR